MKKSTVLSKPLALGCLLLLSFFMQAQVKQSPEPVNLKTGNLNKETGMLSETNQGEPEPFKNMGDQNQQPAPFNDTDITYDYLEHLNAGTNIPYSAETDLEGNTYITGSGSNTNGPEGDFVTIKLNSDGDMEWEKRKPGE